MIEQTVSGPTRYRIGAVARLTGVSADTLRVWERRYTAVSPERSPRGGRLYTGEDVARLRLMKQLVDAGDTIGEIANLDIESLQARVADAQRTPTQLASLTETAPCRIILVGESLATALQADLKALTGITLVATYTNTSDFESHVADVQADVLVIEQATLHEDTAARVIDWQRRGKVGHVVVSYRYASAEALLRLPSSKCSAMRAPVDPRTLQAHCLSVMHASLAVPVPAATDGGAITSPAPPRRYEDEALAQLATLSSAIKCECPRHLAELITSLSAFENYSTECESRSPRDAALHSFLHATASHARHMIEDALDHVIEMENIKF